MARQKMQERATAESVHDRILSTARQLFYREGVRGVGVDTVVAQSGVAKTSLYRWFPSKDALVAAVLQEEAKDRWAGWDRIAQRCKGASPRECLHMHLQAIVKFVTRPDYRGCPFMNALAELPDPSHPARGVVLEVKHELRRRVRALVDAFEGVRDPDELTNHMLLLINGTLLGVSDPERAHTYVPTAADALVNAQLAPA